MIAAIRRLFHRPAEPRVHLWLPDLSPRQLDLIRRHDAARRERSPR